MRRLAALLLALGLAGIAGSGSAVAPAAQAPPGGTGTAAAITAVPPPAADASRRRVILISLDGAGTGELHELYRAGALHAGGFDRFFHDGEVAAALVPADPTLTSVNHVSLATGFPPAATGIVGNQFHPAGTPFTQRASGFDSAIGTETLWEAVRRQGRRVGVLTWPGADGKGDRRRGDWGLVFNGDAEREPQLITLARSNWLPPAAGPRDQAAAGEGAVPPTALVALGGAHGQAGGQAGGGELALELSPVAAASGAGAAEGSGQVAGGGAQLAGGRGQLAGGSGARYEGVTVSALPATPTGRGIGTAVALRVGEWQHVAWNQPGGGASSWIKLLALAPDLSRTSLYVGGAYRTLAYPDRFAESLRDAGLEWPGMPDDADLLAAWQGKPGIDLATWTEQEERLAAFMGAALRLAAARPDWDLLVGYVPVIDTAGHRLLLLDPRQPGYSAARRDELALARERVWRSVDAELGRLLAGLDLARTTVVVVSDHGMAPVHTVIDPNLPLAELGWLYKETAGKRAGGAAGGGAGPAGSSPAAPATPAGAAATGAPARQVRAYAIPDGGAAHVYVDAGGDRAAVARAVEEIANRYAGWRIGGEAPVEKVVRRRDEAALGLDSANSGDLVLFAREGYLFRTLPAGKASAPAPLYGGHGYLASHPDMWASYLALGAGVRPARDETVRVIEVAPRVAAWLGIAPPSREVPPPR